MRGFRALAPATAEIPRLKSNLKPRAEALDSVPFRGRFRFGV